MLFSYKKLLELSNIGKNIKEVVNAINNIGFEVEGYYSFSSKLKGLKFGKVLKTYPNPNADKLKVCEIEFSDKTRTIQTNDLSVNEKDIIIAFVPGSIFNGIKIIEKELKGLVSEGMLFSIEECNIDKNLVRDANKGKVTKFCQEEIASLDIDPINHLQLDDYIIDISILTNRSDANSYYIMANELAAYFGFEIKIPKAKNHKLNNSIKIGKGKELNIGFSEFKNDFQISIKDQLLLIKSNFKTINNPVDLSNLILVMTGQPCHVYDKDKVGDSFVVDYYTGNFLALGNVEMALKETLCVLVDNTPYSIAGVIGSETNAVNENSQNIILELGKFNTKDIRYSVIQSKTNNHSSSQSSKNSNASRIKLGYAIMTQYANVFSDLKTSHNINDNQTIKYNQQSINKTIGYPITSDDNYLKAIKSLEVLNFVFENDKVTIPNYRYDIAISEDIHEEILRFYGYQNIIPTQPKNTTLKIGGINDYSENIISMDYSRVKTYTLTSEEQNKFNPFDFKEDIKLSTIFSNERNTIRNSLLPSIKEVIEYHNNRKVTNLSLFDIGQINQDSKALILVNNSFEKIKKDLLILFQDNLSFVRTEYKLLHKGVSGLIYMGKELVGWIGKPHPSLFDTNYFFGEILINKIEELKQKEILFKKYESSPLKYRDWTISLDKHESIKKYTDKIKSLIGNNKIEIIDQFEKEEKNNTTIRIYLNDSEVKKIDGIINE